MAVIFLVSLLQGAFGRVAKLWRTEVSLLLCLPSAVLRYQSCSQATVTTHATPVRVFPRVQFRFRVL